MGILFYDNLPNLQNLRNGSFEQELGSTWDTTGTPVRTQEKSVGGLFSLKMALVGDSITQEGEHLTFSGTNTIGILLSGDQEASILMKYELLSSGTAVFSYEEEFSFVSSSDFNNNFATFAVEGTGDSGRVSFVYQGTGEIFLDNGKGEGGNTPTRFSDFEGEVVTPNIPEVNSTPIVVPADPQDIRDFLFPFPGEDKSVSVGDEFIEDDGSTFTVPAGFPTMGINFNGLFASFDLYVERERRIKRKKRDGKVNRDDLKFYPEEEDLEHLEGDRTKLKEHLNKLDATSIRSRAFVSWAKNKIAGTRRAFEMRQHSRLDMYAHGFVDTFMDSLSIQEEHGLVHRGAGDE